MNWTQLFQLVTGGGLTFVGCVYPYNLYDILGPGKTLVKKWKNNHHFLGKRDLFLTFTIHYPLLSLFGQDPTYMNSYIYIYAYSDLTLVKYIYIHLFFGKLFFTSNIQGATSLEPLTSHISTEGFYRPILITFAGLQSLFFYMFHFLIKNLTIN